VFEFTKGKTFVSFPKTTQTGTGTPTSYSSVTEGKNNWVVKEILVPSLRKMELYLYSFMVFEKNDYTLHETVLMP